MHLCTSLYTNNFVFTECLVDIQSFKQPNFIVEQINIEDFYNCGEEINIEDFFIISDKEESRLDDDIISKEEILEVFDIDFLYQIKYEEPVEIEYDEILYLTKN